MKRWLFLLLVTTACSSTQITDYSSPPHLLENDNIMVVPVDGVREMFSQDLFSLAKTHLETGKNEVLYLPGAEYEILAAGFSKDLIDETSHFDSLLYVVSKTHDIAYLIKVEVSGLASKKNSLGWYTADELGQQNRMYNQDNERASATLLFNIYHTKTKALDSQFAVTTKMNPMAFGDDDGGETRVNLSDEFAALQKAFKKGLKKIKKGIVKNSN